MNQPLTHQTSADQASAAHNAPDHLSPFSHCLTRADAIRLQDWVATYQHRGDTHAADRLQTLVDNATIVEADQVPTSVVTMNSRLVVEDLASQHRMTLLLTYPEVQRDGVLAVSVSAPAGAALLGAKVGDVVDIERPDGESRAWRILELLYQPEAEGRFDL